jgi:hypothetical protein
VPAYPSLVGHDHVQARKTFVNPPECRTPDVMTVSFERRCVLPAPKHMDRSDGDSMSAVLTIDASGAAHIAPCQSPVRHEQRGEPADLRAPDRPRLPRSRRLFPNIAQMKRTNGRRCAIMGTRWKDWHQAAPPAFDTPRTERPQNARPRRGERDDQRSGHGKPSVTPCRSQVFDSSSDRRMRPMRVVDASEKAQS